MWTCEHLGVHNPDQAKVCTGCQQPRVKEDPKPPVRLPIRAIVLGLAALILLAAGAWLLLHRSAPLPPSSGSGTSPVSAPIVTPASSPSPSPAPSPVSGNPELESWTDVVALCCGDNFIAALGADGTVRTLLDEERLYSEVLDASQWQGIRKLAGGGSFLMGLRQDGTVVYTGEIYDWATELDSWRNIVDISTSGVHALGVRSDGRVEYAGNPEPGQVDPSQGWTGICRVKAVVCAAGTASLGFREDGTLANNDRRCLDASSSGWLNVAIRPDRSVFFWGTDAYALQPDLLMWRGIRQVCPGDTKAIGLQTDGRVVLAGVCPEFTEALTWTDIDRLILLEHFYYDGDMHSMLVGIRKDGSAVSTGTARADTSSWSQITDVGRYQGCLVGLRRDGTVVTAGLSPREVSSWQEPDALPPLNSGWLTFFSGRDVFIPAGFSGDPIRELNTGFGRGYLFRNEKAGMSLSLTEAALSSLPEVEVRYGEGYQPEYYVLVDGVKTDYLDVIYDSLRADPQTREHMENVVRKTGLLSWDSQTRDQGCHTEYRVLDGVVYTLQLYWPLDQADSCGSVIRQILDSFLAA